MCLMVLVSSAPFNAVGPFYNGDAASAPSFDIKVVHCKCLRGSKSLSLKKLTARTIGAL